MPEVYLLLSIFYGFISIYMAIKYDERHQCRIIKDLTSKEFIHQKNKFLLHEKEVEREIMMLKRLREKLTRISREHSQSMG